MNKKRESQRPFEEIYHEHPYCHSVYAPGRWVYVSERIREIHSASLVAGQTLKACWGTYASSDDPNLQKVIDWQEQARSHETFVPVKMYGKIWLVEEEHVKFFDGEEIS